MKLRIFTTIVMVCMVVFTANAQKEAIVRNFTQTTDHIPGNDRRDDMNGTPCALVKVQVVDDIERVEGNKIGDIVKRGVEKWIYMCAGSRNIKIHLKNHLPVRVMFQDYNINGLESNRVYELIVEIPDAPTPANTSQHMSDNTKKQKALKWNFRLGYSFDNMAGGHDLVGTSGFDASLGISKSFGSNGIFWGIEAGAMTYGAQMKDEDAVHSIGATINPRIGIKFPLGKDFSINIYGGPYLGYRFGKSESSKSFYDRSGYSTDEQGYEHSWQEKKSQDLNIKDDNIDIGINLGTELFLNKNFFFDLHIRKGFTSSGKSVISTYNSDGYGYYDDNRDEKSISSLKIIFGVGFQF